MFYAQLSEINWEFHGKTIDTICVNWYYYRAVRTDLNSSWRQIDDYVILIIGSVCGNSSAVEHRLAKAGVASSNLVSRSNFIWRHSQAVRQRSAKPLFPSSILGAASTIVTHAGVAEQADATDLKSVGWKQPYRFDSGPRHQLRLTSVSLFFLCKLSFNTTY